MTLDPVSQARFDRLREQYFPPSINHLRAHVTLFHHLPGEQRAVIAAQLATVCETLAPAGFDVTGVRFLGRGTAYTLAMPAIAELRGRLAGRWRGWLTRQDQQPWQAHVTIQNKVQPVEAKRLFSQLQAGFVEQSGEATGLCLWAYLGGPWHTIAQFPFGMPRDEAIT